MICMNQHEKTQKAHEARRQFEAAARELVEANKRARAAGQLLTAEMQAAAQRLDVAQEKLKQAESVQDRQFEPVALTELVIAKINQTFEPQDRRAAMDLLVNECGRNLPLKADATSRSLDQIRLAIIKLANGNLDELRQHVQTAKSDWREVIVAAENPEEWSIGFSESEKLDEKTRREIAARDRQQYLDWLNSEESQT
jgi:hypothetical protein